ncbi:thiamine pyrophosphate-requiring protein [Pseudonocardia ailaonensis]|uniref:Thiamine pyrophosphate-requiring protein n=1 Tax=Pseudonocardia ailaonensis TaxID=367279 RepID=A0ABN2MJH9_9PSEU
MEKPRTVGEHIAQRLARWGVRRFYGYPGDGIGGMVAGISRAVAEGEAELVQVRHEETAAFAACADVKYGGSPIGCCVVTSGPGAVHALNGLYDAKMDHIPVVALVGQSASTVLGTGYYQEIDAAALYADVAEWTLQVTDPSQVNHAVDRACRIALSRRTVTALILPSDVQQAEPVTEPPFAHGYVHTSSVPSTTPQVPSAADLDGAAAVLNAGERVAILAGAGALHATAELTAVADRLGAGAAKALLGKTVLDDRLPWVTGAIGLLGARPSWDLMQECDTLLLVGTTMPYGEFYPKPGAARAVQIDIDGANNGLRYPTEINLTGDSRATLAALLPLLHAKPDTAWRDRIAGWNQAWEEYSAERVAAEADPVNPEAVVAALSDRLPDDAMLAVDCGTATCWFARDLALRPGQLASLSGTLLSMGGAMPYVLAAKTAHPDRLAVALIGDGAMQMNGLTELVTVATYWRTWTDPRLVVLVLNNRDLAFETWEVRSELGDRPDPNIQGLPDVPYADYARLLGLDGRRLERPDDIGAVWDAALAADRPFVIDAVVDPHVPIIPPHVTIEQLTKALRSQLRGDEALPDLLKEGFRFTVGAATRAVRRRLGDG